MTGTHPPSKTFLLDYRNVLVSLLLVAATLTVYRQVLNYDFVNYDDNLYITDNIHVKAGLTTDNIVWAFTTTDVGNWHPLTWVSHMMDYQIYGMNSGGHHLTNLLFHIANTLLIFFIFRKTTGFIWESALIAALFALHPLHVESVAWVSERKDVLSTFFWMLTMWSYCRYAERPGLSRYIWVVFFLSLGLMSKPMVVTLPFVLLLFDIYPLYRFNCQTTNNIADAEQRRTLFKLVWEKIPLFFLVALSCLLTFYAQDQSGAVKSLEYFSLQERIANALLSYVLYIWKMVYPLNLAVMYPFPAAMPWWKPAAAGILLAGISFLAVTSIKKRPWFTVGWLWYVGTLVPVIGLVQVGSQSMADRYSYIPLIGLFIIIALGIPDIISNWRRKNIWHTAVAPTLLLMLMMITWKQLGYWKNSVTLFNHTLKITSNNYVCHNNLGLTLFNRGQLEAAIDHYFHALRIKPGYILAHFNLGNALRDQGRTKEAIAQYSQVLKRKPDHIETHINLGGVLSDQGRNEEAIHHYMTVLKINPDLVEAYINLGVSMERLGRTNEAANYYSRALRIRPDNALVHFSIGNTFYDQGHMRKAIHHYLQAVQLKPDYIEARINLGVAFIQTGNINEAIGHFQDVLRRQPGNTSARNNLYKLLKAQQNK